MNMEDKKCRYRCLIATIVPLAIILGCGEISTIYKNPTTANPKEDSSVQNAGAPKLALWLAKKHELTGHEDARYDVVMTGWFESAETDVIRTRHPATKTLAGLSPAWVFDDPEWLKFLLTIANGGNANGHLQITGDMYLMLDDNQDGIVDRKCSPPGWDQIYAMDPRHAGWRELILAFYETVANQPQHDGAIVDMVDAYPFCEGAWSGGEKTPLDADTWVSAQSELLSLIRKKIPANKWLIANAGHDFAAGSPFPQHVNGYLLENFLGSWGATLEEGLASAQRALRTTKAPHIVVFAVDTDDTGEIHWTRFRTGLAASLLMDNTYFAFDYGSRDHGGVTNWWFPDYYTIALGQPLGAYTLLNGVYRRDFEKGVIVVAADRDASVSLDALHLDIASGETVSLCVIPKGDARIFIRFIE